MSFDDIYSEYFKRIFVYCYAKLKDYRLAEECTQDVFLAFYKKMNRLKLTTNIEAWLYNAAKYQIKTYYRSKRNYISLEDLPYEKEPAIEEDQSQDIFGGIIDEEELKVLTDFYISGEKIDKIAEDSRLTRAAAYQKIRRIKQKIIQNSDKLHKLIKK